MAVTGDPRFHAAVDHAAASLPQETAETLASLVTITPAQLDATMAQHAAARAVLVAQYGPTARIGAAQTPEDARNPAVRSTGQMDDVFFNGWRFAEGWLPAAERRHALHVFHDPLAIAMRRAVVARVFPGTGGSIAPCREESEERRERQKQEDEQQERQVTAHGHGPEKGVAWNGSG